MVKKIFFSLGCTIFSLSYGMQSAQELIKQYKETFPVFVSTIHKDINTGKNTMKLPGISNLIEKRAKERGYEGNLKNDIAFLARFFNKENKETRRKLTGDKPEKKSRKKKRTLEEGTFGNQEHQQIINSIFTLFQKEKQTLNALQNCVHQVNIQTFNLAQDATKDDVCKKVQEKQNNVYVISDETYFAQTACILFTLYVFEELYGPNGKK